MTFKEYRRENDLKQIELVELMREAGLEISQPVLSNIENGKTDPTPEMCAWLAAMEENQDEDLNATETSILEHLRKASKDYPLSRAMMMAVSGLTDRECRRILGKLRDKGHWIVDSDHGYYITDDKDVFLGWSLKYTAYARTILKHDTAMRRKLQG